MAVGLGIGGRKMLGFDAENFREEWVVAKRYFPDDGAGRRVENEPLVCLVGFQQRVKYYKEFRVFFADGGDQRIPTVLGNRLRLLDEDAVDGLEAFDARHVMFQAGENECRAVRADDGGLLDFVVRA